MSKATAIRWGWLKFMYLYTVVGAGGFGLGMIFLPDTMISLFRWPRQEPVVFGINASVYVAFALVSVLGLRSPLKFVPVALLQLCDKSIWLVGVVVPLLVRGQLPMSSTLPIVMFSTYIVGDLIAIPFSYVFAKDPA